MFLRSQISFSIAALGFWHLRTLVPWHIVTLLRWHLGTLLPGDCFTFWNSDIKTSLTGNCLALCLGYWQAWLLGNCFAYLGWDLSGNSWALLDWNIDAYFFRNFKASQTCNWLADFSWSRPAVLSWNRLAFFVLVNYWYINTFLRWNRITLFRIWWLADFLRNVETNLLWNISHFCFGA